jgi:hypothetical protein
MTLTILMTVVMTVTVVSVMLTISADRIGLGFGTGAKQAYPADSSLSPALFPAPHNPEPEQLRSRQERSAMHTRPQTRTQLHPDGTNVLDTDVPDVVPPASLVGCVPPGCSADRVTWRMPAIDPSRSCFSLASVVRSRLGSDCQSPDRCNDNDNANDGNVNDKRNLARKTVLASAAGK